jgi:hypothetical protein
MNKLYSICALLIVVFLLQAGSIIHIPSPTEEQQLNDLRIKNQIYLNHIEDEIRTKDSLAVKKVDTLK